MWFRRLAVLISLLLVLIPARSLAHEIPSDILVRMFIKPEGQRLRVLVRVPLNSISEIQWPESRPGMLYISRADPQLREAVLRKIAGNIELFEGERRLDAPRVAAVMASFPSDRSFDSYESALDHVTGPRLQDDLDFLTQQGLLDALLEYNIQSQGSAFSIHPNFTMSGVTVQTTLRLLSPDRPERALSLHNDPGLVRLDPRWFQAAGRFVVEGFFYILDRPDHLLFLFCLIIPFRRLKSLVLIVTSFTVAHSITLIASAYGMAPDALWFPPLIETLIATSILYMALENIVAPGLERRWIITFAFGLAHGFGFSFALRDSLQLAGSHMLTSLVAFNAGVEVGQILVLLVLVPVFAMLFRYIVAERLGTIILSALAAHAAWHWLIERFAVFRRYRIELPVVDTLFLILLLRWMMLIVIVAGAAWLIFSVLGPRLKGKECKTLSQGTRDGA